jgi:hypothetical protein
VVESTVRLPLVRLVDADDPAPVVFTVVTMVKSLYEIDDMTPPESVRGEAVLIITVSLVTPDATDTENVKVAVPLMVYPLALSL